ncbi:MAG: hypothetical protein HYY15_01145 [Candidatus Omnitrophica bacterium]|nr:hypothetical protein [Candidatus Omnitrophota bacterium]
MKRVVECLVEFVMAAAIGLCGAGIAVWADSRPIQELPKDVVHWSTVWTEVPKQMVEVNRDLGPLAALTWGPAKGTVVMLQTTGEALWNTLKYEESTKQRRRASPSYGSNKSIKGPIFRYEF